MCCSPWAKRKRRLDSLEAAQGAPRAPRGDSREERSPWLPLETRPDSPGDETGLILRCAGKVRNPFQTKQGNRPSCRDQEE